MCDDVGMGLKLWGGTLAGIHAKDPNNDHYSHTQNQIDKAMTHTQRMDISITPKMHNMEMHVINQMQNIPGGIGRMMEHWIEQYHQIGYQFDVAICQVGSMKLAADVVARMERRISNQCTSKSACK
jgi:hypothetical protein